MLVPLQRFLAREKAAEIIWISDGVAVEGTGGFAPALKAAIGDNPLTISRVRWRGRWRWRGVDNSGAGMSVRVLARPAAMRGTPAASVRDRPARPSFG